MTVCKNCDGAWAHNKERLCASCEIEIHGTDCTRCGIFHVHPDVDEDLICGECWIEINAEEIEEQADD